MVAFASFMRARTFLNTLIVSILDLYIEVVLFGVKRIFPVSLAMIAGATSVPCICRFTAGRTKNLQFEVIV
jgi:hypothetical protein